MVYITHIRLGGGASHEHITDVMWKNPADGKTGASTRSVMVEWIDKGNVARVKDSRGEVDVLVVRASPPYLRTYADGRWTDNLLALPRF